MNRMGKGQPSWSSTPTRNVSNSLLEYRPNSCCSYTGTEWHITTVKILHTLKTALFLLHPKCDKQTIRPL